MSCFEPEKAKTTSTSYLPSQANWLGQALELYGPTLGKGEESFPGQTVAPFSPAQKQALDVGDFMKYFSPDSGIPLYGETGTALSGILSGTTGAKPYTKEAAEKYFTSTIENPAYKRWSENIRPEIESAYAGPGYWSSARANAVRKGATDMGDWLGQQYGGLMWDVEQANREIEEAKAGRALSGIGLGMEYGRVPTSEAAARLTGRGGVFELLGQEQAQRQAEINADIQRWASEKRITDPENLEILMNLLNMGYSTSVARDYGAGWFGGTKGYGNFTDALSRVAAMAGGGGGGAA